MDVLEDASSQTDAMVEVTFTDSEEKPNWPLWAALLLCFAEV